MQETPLFDELSQKFNRNIYTTFKGRLRLAILKRDFELLKLHQRPLFIYDIGAGQGQFSQILAENGHRLTLIEPAKNMLEVAEKNFKMHNLTAKFINKSLEDLPTLELPQPDLILCHAMIEWLENPFDLFFYLAQYLTTGTRLSLLFYNREGLIYHNLIRGNFRYITKGNFRGEHGGFTPISPIDARELEEYLYHNNFQILHKSGIRTYYDFMNREARNRISEEDHLAMELNYSLNPDYHPHSRYLHWVIEKQ